MQRTLKNEIRCAGTGLHTGRRVVMTMAPAAAGQGIVFRRTGGPGGPADIPARIDNVVADRLNTTLGLPSGARLSTVEHVMAALNGCGVDNALITVEGPEVPAMDGSAAPFVFLIESAGIVEQAEPRLIIEVLRPVCVGNGRKSASLTPCPAFSFGFEIDFEARAIGRQEAFMQLDDTTFRDEFSRARTFGLARDVAAMRAQGLARGGSLENSVVFGEDGVLNSEGLRYDNECVRHKLLDSVGDLYLAGARIMGHFQGQCSGHADNHAVLRALFGNRNNWRRRMARHTLTATPERAYA